MSLSVLLAVFYICFGAIDAAAISGGHRSTSALKPANANVHTLRVARQAYSDEDDSEEEDDVQTQNFALQQQIPDDSQEDSDEDDADDDGDDNGRRRRRRDTQAAEAEKIVQSELPMQEMVEDVAVPEPLPAPATNAPTVALENISEESAAPNAPSRNTSVLILIRDALKKVTTLPTEQVATNALQYFQLFEHFLQQTIEEVIGDDDDDEDEAAAAGVTETPIKPDSIFTPEEEEIIAGVEEILKEPELVNKQPTQQPKPAETPLEAETIVNETKPAPGGPNPDAIAKEKPASAVEPANAVEPAASAAWLAHRNWFSIDM